MHEHTRPDQHDDGFTLVEIIIAIVLVGILSAVVVVGVGNILQTGSAASCAASADAARTGATAYWTSHASYPTTFTQLVSPAPPFLELPDSATVDAAGTTVTTPDWALTLTSTSGAPTFACGNGTRASTNGSGSGTAACPGTYTAWVGEYYNTITPTGTPALCRNDADVNFNWAAGSPDPSIPANNYAARWTRTVNVTAGSHTFTVGSDDGHRLYIDGVLVLDTWRDQAYATRSTTQTLTAGNHTVVVEYYERGGYARATLTWT